MWSVTEQRRAQQILEEYAFEDALTGIGNRRRFDACLREEWTRHRRLGLPLGPWVTVSAGAVSEIPADDGLARFEQTADERLYAAKRAGRNRVCG